MFRLKKMTNMTRHTGRKNSKKVRVAIESLRITGGTPREWEWSSPGRRCRPPTHQHSFEKNRRSCAKRPGGAYRKKHRLKKTSHHPRDGRTSDSPPRQLP